MGLELAEQLGWRVPTRSSPDRRGHRLIGMWKAFGELERRLTAPSGPRCSRPGEGCAPLSGRRGGRGARPALGGGRGRSRRASECPGPVGDLLIIRAVRESGGAALAVSDEARRSASGSRSAGRRFSATRPAATLAWREALGAALVDKDETAVLVNCATVSNTRFPTAARPRPARADRLAALNFTTYSVIASEASIQGGLSAAGLLSSRRSSQ